MSVSVQNVFFLLKNSGKVVCGTIVTAGLLLLTPKMTGKSSRTLVSKLSRVIVKDSYIFGVRAARGTRGVLSRIICVDYSEKKSTVFAGGACLY